jgi:hypothetical protein
VESQHQTGENGERISELDDRILEVTQSEQQEDNRNNKTLKQSWGICERYQHM